MISVAAIRSLGPIVPIHTVILWSLLRAAGGVKFLMKKARRDVVFGCGRSVDDRSEGLPPQISTKSPWSRALTSTSAARTPKRRRGPLRAPMRSGLQPDLQEKFREFVSGYGLPDFVICLPDFDLGVISFL